MVPDLHESQISFSVTFFFVCFSFLSFFFSHFVFKGSTAIVGHEVCLRRKLCVVCQQDTRREPLLQAKTLKPLQTIFDSALKKEEFAIAKTIQLFVNNDSFPHYHRKCLSKIVYQYQSSNNQSSKKILKRAFEKIAQIIQEEVIKNKNYKLIGDVRNIYEEEAGKLFSDANLQWDKKRIYSIQEKIEKHFGNEIEIRKLKAGISAVVAAGSDPIFVVEDKLDDPESIRRLAAKDLRRIIFGIEKNPLKNNFTTKDLIAGECSSIPKELTEFFLDRLSDNNRRRNSDRVQRLAKLFSEDLIYNVTNGGIKTSKQICLGMFLKNLTGSKNLVTIANRSGACCSYPVVESLESELAYSIDKSERVTPPEIVLEGGEDVVLAYNNFDRFVDSRITPGKETLHDTVGIAVQPIRPGDPDYLELEERAIRSCDEENHENSVPHRYFHEDLEDSDSEDDQDSVITDNELDDGTNIINEDENQEETMECRTVSPTYDGSITEVESSPRNEDSISSNHGTELNETTEKESQEDSHLTSNFSNKKKKRLRRSYKSSIKPQDDLYDEENLPKLTRRLHPKKKCWMLRIPTTFISIAFWIDAG